VLRSRGGEVAGAWLPAGAPLPGPEWLRAPGALDAARDRPVGGHLVAEAWQIVAEGTERLRADLESDAGATGPSPVPDGCHLLGDGALLLGRDVRIEPGVVFDTREGPVRLDEGVEVRTGSRLQGPLWAGPRTRLLGGTFTALAAGPRCTLRGEIEESIVLGFANKAHDGFLGHSVVGRWVNLGALTTNSDLKNNYGPIRVGGPGGERETGLLKLGCLIGDHAKTAIGTRLNAGTVVGAGANLFGDGVPPRWVQPFAWGNRPDAPPYERERFLDTAARVMARREVALGEAGRGWLGACWDAARGTPQR
jgi:UDP-N-acetylglucosamine diphosphorylase/glucosamine-1-phosphate N-acetyltransferase